MSQRVESLDHLRGLMAVSVMVFHYHSWAIGKGDAESILSRLGIYAVGSFFVLSGLSLAIVYKDRLSDAGDILAFSIKRVFRIFPLFWASVTFVLILNEIAKYRGGGADIDSWVIFLNYTLLFGFLDHAATLSVGAWSIGNEMVFYALFPFVFFLGGRWEMRGSFLGAVTLASVGLYVCFAYFFLDDRMGLSDQFDIYTHPLNQLALFMLGCCVGFAVRPASTKHGKIAGGLLVVAGALTFVLYPADGDRIALVTDGARVTLSLSVVAIVLGTYLADPLPRSSIAEVLGFFGRGCYSIYLLHPIVAIPWVWASGKLGLAPVTCYVLAAITTLILSWASFRFVELPMMNHGSALSRFLKKKVS